MARAGGGSRSSSRSSSSHRSSSSRRSSGHRSSYSSSRAGSSSRSSSRSSFGGSSSSFGSSFGRSFGNSLGTGLGRNLTGSYGSHRNRTYGGSYGGSYSGESYNPVKWSAPFIVIILAIVCLVIAILMYAGTIPSITGSKFPASTIARTKIENVPIYDYNVVKDEINYVDEEFTVGAGLKTFYDKTGVQPYIYFKAYDSSLVTDADKDTWAENYFDEQGFSENSMSFIYFEEKNPDDVGYMSIVPGYDTVTVLDSEALDIFWSYWDWYWFGDGTTEDVIINAFTKTGTAIMKVDETQTTATMGVIKVVAILGVVAIFFITTVVIIKGNQKKRQQEIEKTKADAEILKQPLERMTSSEDRMEDEYK